MKYEDKMSTARQRVNEKGNYDGVTESLHRLDSLQYGVHMCTVTMSLHLEHASKSAETGKIGLRRLPDSETQARSDSDRRRKENSERVSGQGRWGGVSCRGWLLLRITVAGASARAKEAHLSVGKAQRDKAPGVAPSARQ